MQRPRTFVPIAISLGSAAALCAAFASSPAVGTDPGRSAAALATEDEPANTATTRSAAALVSDLAGPRAGATYTAISPVLASQLALDPSGAAVVIAIAKGSRSALAGLQEHDVVTHVDEEPATLEQLDAALDSGERVELSLLREGTPAVVILPSESASPTSFKMADALPIDHPVVRVRELERLRDSLQSRSDDTAKRRKDVARELQETREQARAAAEALHSQCTLEAERLLNQKRSALYEVVDQALCAERVQPLAALRVDLDALVPSKEVGELDEAIHQLAHSFEDGFEERVEGLPSKNGLNRIGRAISARIHERVQEPWSGLNSKHSGYVENLGETHDERMAWAAEHVEDIRRELHERIDCAVERSLETFAKRLEARLRDLDVPRSAELEASILDLSAQLDAWTHGFVAGTAEALETYRSQVEPARAHLSTTLPDRFAEARASWGRATEVRRRGSRRALHRARGSLPQVASCRSRKGVPARATCAPGRGRRGRTRCTSFRRERPAPCASRRKGTQ